MAGSKVAEHPCEICEEPTTNLYCCSRECLGERMRTVGSFRVYTPEPIETRYLYNVLCGLHPNDCWQWLSYYSSRGAPMVWQTVGKRRQIRAHRIAWKIFKGPIPKGHVVSNSCQDPACTNPLHLICGTQGEIVGKLLRLNRKGARFGNDHNSTKLPDTAVELIRKMYREGRKKELKEVCHRLADHYDMNFEYIRSISRTKGRGRKVTNNRLR